MGWLFDREGPVDVMGDEWVDGCIDGWDASVSGAFAERGVFGPIPARSEAFVVVSEMELGFGERHLGGGYDDEEWDDYDEGDY